MMMIIIIIIIRIKTIQIILHSSSVIEKIFMEN